MLDAARLGFDPLIPWILLWCLAAAAGVLWGFYVLRRGRAWLTRALAASILTLALSNPLWIEEEREPLKDIVAVVLDKSESMNFQGRTEAAQAAFEALRTRIGADETLELRVAETDPDADGTDLYSALYSALSDAPRDRLAGAILITDGQADDIPEDTSAAEQLGPIHGLIVGSDAEIDRRVEILSAPSFGIVDTEIEMMIQVDDPTESNLPVSISINGEAKPPQRVPVGEPTKITLTLPRRGDNLVVLEVEGRPGELTFANNLASAPMSGVRDRLRVLLITGEPHSGARVWRDLLKADPSVDLVHFTILRPPTKTDAATTDELALIQFPRRQLFAEKLDQFDLVIFDHEIRRQVIELEYLNNIARYVEQGGALMIAAGPPYPDSELLYRTPLAAVLPGRATGRVIAGRFVPELTPLGRRHSVTAGLPTQPEWGPWRRYMELDPGRAEALIQTPDGAPLLVLNRVAKGRVASFMSDQIWLWARGHEGGGPYAELIRRTAHWLMKEPELEEELLKLEADTQDVQATLRTLSDDPPPLRMTDPGGIVKETPWTLTQPGEYSATVAAPGLGLYSASTGDLSSVVLRGPKYPREYIDVRSTTDKLQPLATATLGGMFRIGADASVNLPNIRRVGVRGNASGSDWIGLRSRNAYAVRSTRSEPLLPGVVGMGLAVLFMMLAWRREGR
ncbi:hypothetical protein GC169_12620 [bacterium]|nr:hypothetical protein [bacterium]